MTIKIKETEGDLIKKFAKDHRLKVVKDECGEYIVRGRIYESNLYEYSPDELGVLFIADRPRTELYNKFKAACLGAGMTQRQSGDYEGSFSFSPTNPAQAKIAIKGIKAKAKKIMTQEQLDRLAEMRKKAKGL